MASGIVSLAALQHDLPRVSAVLLAVAVLVFACLLVAHLRRFAATRRGFAEDLRETGGVVPLLTFVASCDVLGVRLLDSGADRVALALWLVSLAAWASLNAAFAIALVRRAPPARAVGGDWLLLVVATQAVAAHAAVLALRFDASALLVVAVALSLLGLAAYPVLAALVVRALRAGAPFTPDHWIAMGALAISAVAAGNIAALPPQLGVADLLRRAADAVAVVGWLGASGWVPWLVATEARRGIAAFRYDGRRWATVFPLGMYSVATFQLRTDHLVDVGGLSATFLGIAVAAWVAAAWGAARSIAHAAG
jgi:tellurite resistance protein TehA-like permease